MPVDVHPSRRPSPPRKPPATTTTDGQANTVSKTMQGWGEMEYGSRNGGDLRLGADQGSERASDFKAWSQSDGKARKAGHKSSNEGEEKSEYKSSRPGDEKSSDEPG